jgi:toxin ParE1/3/4
VAKPVRLRALAADDIDGIVAYYLDEAGADVAVRFVDALERTLHRIADQPLSGSLRFAFELGIPDLRCVSVTRFPYLAFYRDAPDHLDVWRLLHVRRESPRCSPSGRTSSRVALDDAPGGTPRRSGPRQQTRARSCCGRLAG